MNLMRKMSNPRAFRAMFMTALAMILLQSTTHAASVCNNLITGSSATATLSGLHGAIGSVLTVTLLIIITIMSILGILYAIGRALQVTKFLRFVKGEFGEIMITLLVVFIFLGTFNYMSSGVVPQNLVAVAGPGLNANVFIADCNILSNAASAELVATAQLGAYQIVFGLAKSLTVYVKPNGFGFQVVPYGGLGVVTHLIGTMISAGFLLSALPLGAAFLMVMFYLMFPLFLYAGIILRSLPWTRAAGGAFIGVFAAFYVLFPLLLYTLLGAYTSAGGLIAPTTSLTSKIISIDSILKFASSLADILGLSSGLIPWFISNIVDPMVYITLSLVISLIMSFDFLEAVGDLLGAQSLSSSRALKKIL